MREIKFKVWDEENKEISKRTMPMRLNSDWIVEFNIKEWQVWLQYTWLEDKNGKEVYEGDIFKKDDTIWEVQWYNKQARFAMYYIVHREKFIDCYLNEVEIIWNIYENPELLNNKD